ncbi:MAG: hypothetical protein ACR2LR_11565 [Hassallia sp.]
MKDSDPRQLLRSRGKSFITKTCVYEKTWFLTYEGDRYFKVYWFRYAIHRDCKSQLAIAIWFPFPQGQLHHIVRGIGSKELPNH